MKWEGDTLCEVLNIVPAALMVWQGDIIYHCLVGRRCARVEEHGVHSQQTWFDS